MQYVTVSKQASKAMETELASRLCFNSLCAVHSYIELYTVFTAAPPLRYGCLSASSIGGNLSIASSAIAKRERTRSQTLTAYCFSISYRVLFLELLFRVVVLVVYCAFSLFPAMHVYSFVCAYVNKYIRKRIGSITTTCSLINEWMCVYSLV